MNLAARVIIGVVAAAGAWAATEIIDRTQAQVAIACVDPEERVRVREIVVQGLDGALKDRVYHLFEQWVRDTTEQPKRATTGLTNAINAHIRARKDALRWNPPPCDGAPQ
jgi:hypothetical protein